MTVVPLPSVDWIEIEPPWAATIRCCFVHGKGDASQKNAFAAIARLDVTRTCKHFALVLPCKTGTPFGIGARGMPSRTLEVIAPEPSCRTLLMGHAMPRARSVVTCIWPLVPYDRFMGQYRRPYAARERASACESHSISFANSMGFPKRYPCP